MTVIAFSVDSLDSNRAGRLSQSQLHALQTGQRLRSRGLVGHLLHAHDAFARDVSGGRVDSVAGAVSKRSWSPSVPDSTHNYQAASVPTK